MKLGNVCVIHATRPGEWPAWYLARIVEFETDNEGDSVVTRAQIVGESFKRDEWNAIFLISDEAKQAAAEYLASQQWGPHAYQKLDDLRTAILAIAP